jgi:hypothetical protein
MVKRGAVLLVVLVAALAAASPASAWWAEGSSLRTGAFGTVTVTTLPGERNDVTAIGVPGGGFVSQSAPKGSVLIRDESATVTPPPAGRGEGCTTLDEHTVRCVGVGPYGGPAQVDWLFVDLGDGDDRLTIPATSNPLYPIGDGGPGNDTISTYDADGATYGGGDGNDRITVRGSQGGYLYPDSVHGDAGDDVLDLVNLDDNYPSCGDGYDLLYADGNDTPPAAGDCEDVRVTLPSTSLPG